MKLAPEFDADLLSRYNQNVPRYTSYPTAPQFEDSFSRTEWLAAIKNNTNRGTPLSLYFHIPFCRSLCFYCACSKIITPNKDRSLPYFDGLLREIELVSETLSENQKKVSQLHLGGGTPTFLSSEQLTQLMSYVRTYFDLVDDGEYSIEIDPRAASVETIKVLTELGFNRMSFGIQDFDPIVQKAVNRIQSPKQTFEQIDAARAGGVKSINIDLIYGLPMQNRFSFAQTLDTVIAQRPERVAVYSYAHLPQSFKSQRHIEKYQLPNSNEKMALLELSIDRFLAAGYEYIGLDHFALPSDDLAIARRNGSLQRNFQGYSTQKQCDMLGFGITSIGRVGDSYYQNIKSERDYLETLNLGQLPVTKGYTLNLDDRLRYDVIMGLMCQGLVDIREIELAHNIDFYRYFDKVLPALLGLCDDNLLLMGDQKIEVTARGQLMLRSICQVFDAYHIPQFSHQLIQTRAI